MFLPHAKLVVFPVSVCSQIDRKLQKICGFHPFFYYPLPTFPLQTEILESAKIKRRASADPYRAQTPVLKFIYLFIYILFNNKWKNLKFSENLKTARYRTTTLNQSLSVFDIVKTKKVIPSNFVYIAVTYLCSWTI